MNNIIKRLQEQNQKKSVFRVPVNVYHNFESIKMPDLVRSLERIVPPKVFQGLKSIEVGNFQDFIDRNISAMSANNKIYVKNDLDLEKTIRAILHELAHFVEGNYWDLLYEDSRLEGEFVGKRKHLYHFLKSNNKPIESIKLFLNPRFSQKLDDYFYKEIGYDYLDSLNTRYGYGPTTYSITSLSEYFADGFEMFILGQGDLIKNTCPILYNKLYSLLTTLGE